MVVKASPKEKARSQTDVREKDASRSVSASGAYYRNEALASSLSDEELMALYQKGDEGAFEEIYARYGKKIYGFLMRRLGNPDNSAELFQD